jgi:hypothetical protein
MPSPYTLSKHMKFKSRKVIFKYIMFDSYVFPIQCNRQRAQPCNQHLSPKRILAAVKSLRILNCLSSIVTLQTGARGEQIYAVGRSFRVQEQAETYAAVKLHQCQLIQKAAFTLLIHLIFLWAHIIDTNNIDNQLDATITVYW